MRNRSLFMLGFVGFLFLGSQGTAWAGTVVPEIPGEAASFLAAGMTGTALWLRSFFHKKK